MKSAGGTGTEGFSRLIPVSKRGNVQAYKVTLSPSQKQSFAEIRQEVSDGFAGERTATETGQMDRGESVNVSWGSAYPEYFQSKGLTKADVLPVLDRIIKVALEMVCVKNHRSMSRPRRIRRRRSRGIFRPRPFLLTRNEAAFFNVLSAVVAHHYLISCKVRLADVVTCAERDWRRGHANRIAQKHVDFVVTHVASSRIVAAIELDDRTHAKPERRLRDAFLNDLFRQMRIRLIRVPAAWQYDPETIAAYLTRAGLKAQNAAEMKKPRQ